MVPPDTDATLIWETGDLPVSARYADPYYSRVDGLAETRHVFLDGTGLPGAWAGREHFRVAELGFGTGLNFAATLALWRATAPPDARLDYTGFEIAPLAPEAMARALARWPELAAETAALLAVWPGAEGGTADLGRARLTLVTGDARKTLARWQGRADAWFLDGFAPARNPQMWEPALMAEVFAHAAPGARLATYSAAGHVRRALAAAGFRVRKIPGFGTKREMTVAERDGHPELTAG